MRFLALLLVALSFGGCAMPTANTFAEHVESVGVTAGGNYDAKTGGYGGQVGTSFVLRDPRKGLAK